MKDRLNTAMRDNPFQHVPDDQLFEAYTAADKRYGEVLMEEIGVDRAAVVAWIIRSGEMSVICREYLDEMRRRRAIREAILNPVLLGSMEVTAETTDEELDRFLFDDPSDDQSG